MIRLYEEGDHGGGFVGYRVAVSVDGEKRQQYFSFMAFGEIQATEKAKKLHAHWLAEQKAARPDIRLNDNVPKPRYKKFPKGITATTHYKLGFTYLSLKAYNHQQTKVKTWGIHYDDYEEKYAEAVTWIKKHRIDAKNVTSIFPYSWPYFARTAS